MAKWKPGPGWTEQHDGSYAPHSFTSSEFSGAQAVAMAFRVAAVLVLGADAVAAMHTNQTTLAEKAALLYAIAGATILVACGLAFFGYVLDLLVALHFDSRLSQAANLARAVAEGTLEPPG